MKKNVLVIAMCMTFVGVNAQLKVLQSGNATIGGGNSSFPYSSTTLSVNGSVSLKSTLDVMNLSNTNSGWGGQIRFTANNLSGINHIIVDNGSNQLILFPGYQNSNSSRNVTISGGLNVSGYAALAGGGYFSDQRLKTNIIPLKGSLDKIMQLRGVTYTWQRDITIMSGDQKIPLTEGLPEGPQIGFIAQEVEQIVPEIVKETTLGYKALEYHTITALLVDAMQEQQEQINRLESQLAAVQGNGTQIHPEARLGQNYPNPFDNSTTIEYDLPLSYGQSELFITDLQGKKIFSLPMEAGEKLKINVSSDRLTEGIYLYSIVSGGMVLTSRQFIVSKK